MLKQLALFSSFTPQGSRRCPRRSKLLHLPDAATAILPEERFHAVSRGRRAPEFQRTAAVVPPAQPVRGRRPSWEWLGPHAAGCRARPRRHAQLRCQLHHHAWVQPPRVRRREQPAAAELVGPSALRLRQVCREGNHAALRVAGGGAVAGGGQVRAEPRVLRTHQRGEERGGGGARRTARSTSVLAAFHCDCSCCFHH